MKKFFIVPILFLMTLAATPSVPPEGFIDRQDLAREIYNFLFDHALCVEGHKTAAELGILRHYDGFVPESAPCDWVYSGAYQLHWSSKELYDVNKPLKDIQPPVSDWRRGGYSPYGNPLVYAHHEWIVFKINLLIIVEKNGVPKPIRLDY